MWVMLSRNAKRGFPFGLGFLHILLSVCDVSMFYFQFVMFDVLLSVCDVCIFYFQFVRISRSTETNPNPTRLFRTPRFVGVQLLLHCLCSVWVFVRKRRPLFMLVIPASKSIQYSLWNVQSYKVINCLHSLFNEMLLPTELFPCHRVRNCLTRGINEII